eukprot:GHVN01043760.1.p1 GENE.GHVN01043760.1~~GHVN01043760.1.p1  ORF type:complete len:120 (-),score=18.34 GHVN01043760.1:262-621(-)
MPPTYTTLSNLYNLTVMDATYCLDRHTDVSQNSPHSPHPKHTDISPNSRKQYYTLSQRIREAAGDSGWVNTYPTQGISCSNHHRHPRCCTCERKEGIVIATVIATVLVDDTIHMQGIFL